LLSQQQALQIISDISELEPCDKADWDEADPKWCGVAGKTITGGGEIEKKLIWTLFFIAIVSWVHGELLLVYL